jgi:hypothetical protein
VVAAAASTRLLQAIHEAARNAGWSLEAIVPAEAAWAGAGAAWARRKAGTSLLLVSHEDRTDLLRIEEGGLAGVRRFRAGGADAALIAEAATESAAGISIVGVPEARRELSHALAGRGVNAETPTTAVTDATDAPDFLAAVFATGEVAPRLVTDVERAQRALWVGRLTARLAAAAAIVLVLAGVIEFWGVRRELRIVQAQRDALRPQLATTLVGRTTVETAYQQLAVLANAERTAPEWSTVIAGISAQLPLEAYLTGFRGNGDSVAVDGLASRAARVFDALDRVGTLSGVRATAPVRLETPIDGPPLERFTISARVGQAAPAPARGTSPGRGGARR